MFSVDRTWYYFSTVTDLCHMLSGYNINVQTADYAAGETACAITVNVCWQLELTCKTGVAVCDDDIRSRTGRDYNNWTDDDDALACLGHLGYLLHGTPAVHHQTRRSCWTIPVNSIFSATNGKKPSDLDVALNRKTAYFNVQKSVCVCVVQVVKVVVVMYMYQLLQNLLLDHLLQIVAIGCHEKFHRVKTNLL